MVVASFSVGAALCGRPLFRIRGRPQSAAPTSIQTTTLLLFTNAVVVRMVMARDRLRSEAELTRHFLKQAYQVVGVFLFHRENPFQHSASGRVVVADVVDHLAIAVDGDPFGH